MNRRTWNMFFGVALSFILASANSIKVCAQDAATTARITDISNRYNECVYSSAISHVSALNRDINKAAEQGFSSCMTEEKFLINSLLEVGATSELANKTLLEKQTGIKRELRKMVEEVLMKK